MNAQQPLVSILMTAYNREDFIAEAIESVLASSYKNFELIVVDDCSQDSSIAIARKYEDLDNRVKVFINVKNLKDYPNRNKAATYAKGKYIKYLDSDDLIYPWGLEIMVFCMEKYPTTALGLISYNFKDKSKLPLLLSSKEAFNQFYFKGSLIACGPSSSIIRRDVFESLGGFSGKPYIGDTELWFRIAAIHSIVALPLDLIWWREHENQQFKEGEKYYEKNNYKLFLSFLEDSNCPLNDYEKKLAIRNFKNRYSRNIIKLIVMFNFIKAFDLLRNYNLTIFDFIVSIRKNKYP